MTTNNQSLKPSDLELEVQKAIHDLATKVVDEIINHDFTGVLKSDPSIRESLMNIAIHMAILKFKEDIEKDG